MVSTNNNNENMSEGMYIDAMNQLKEMNEARELENKKHKSELLDLKKELISAYGIVRVLDQILENQVMADEPVIEVKILIETLREYLSQFVEDNILYNRRE